MQVWTLAEQDGWRIDNRPDNLRGHRAQTERRQDGQHNVDIKNYTLFICSSTPIDSIK